MGMHDRNHVGARFIDRAVDEALEVRLALVAAQHVALQIELHDVARLDELRSERAREEVALRVFGMAHADVAVRIDHVLIGENPVRYDEIVEVHTFSGVRGMSRCRTPSALQTAFTTAAGAPTAPASPAPLTPSGLVVQGT